MKKVYCPHIESYVPPCPESCKGKSIPNCVRKLCKDVDFDSDK